MTPSQPMEARGTTKALAAEVMMVLCMASVNVPEEPEKTNDTRSTALPLDGVTSAVLDGVRVFDGVREAVSVVVDERETVGVTEGVEDHDEM